MVTRFLCAACERLAPAASFSVEAGGLRLVCARCGAASALEVDARFERAEADVETQARAAEGASSRVVSLRAVDDAVALARDASRAADPFEVPEDRCPKCLSPRASGTPSCPSCGLTFSNYLASETEASPELASLLRSVLERWDDPAEHEKLLAVATARGELAQVGRFYRLRLLAAPLDPVAQRGRDEVIRMASVASSLAARSDESANGEPTWKYVFLAILLLAAVGMVAVLVKQLKG